MISRSKSGHLTRRTSMKLIKRRNTHSGVTRPNKNRKVTFGSVLKYLISIDGKVKKIYKKL